MKCVGAGAVPPPILQVPSAPPLSSMQSDEAICIEDDVSGSERSKCYLMRVGVYVHCAAVARHKINVRNMGLASNNQQIIICSVPPIITLPYFNSISCSSLCKALLSSPDNISAGAAFRIFSLVSVF